MDSYVYFYKNNVTSIKVEGINIYLARVTRKHRGSGIRGSLSLAFDLLCLLFSVPA